MSRVKNNPSTEILQGDDTPNDHHARCNPPTDRVREYSVAAHTINNEANPDSRNKSRDQIEADKKIHLRISCLNSLYCALMCLFAGLWALIVFISVYAAIRMTATWLLRPQQTLLNEHPAILNEFIGARVAIACVAMLLGGLSAGIAHDLPHLIDLSTLIRTAAQASAGFCALMCATGDIQAIFLSHRTAPNPAAIDGGHMS
ncbi:hypothetical protein SAMN02744133_102492 [Thalassospira xiamenensis M-5 = DSM 17429]|uniref:Uncharacterized protein n=1 Tax=Thalassospira xiamenensis M-5 = DSM 17429 TaxID=1123366 RepID=A0AB72U7W5_9PROT|nr:hypothetical protein [Thalassospira xiamenensis]AJD50303.1 hypothetical protein TH3_00885 [Thalassospira xiamenensis M-5 = DSM 17429]SIS81655.1 hypothetical protein SAMN02744133_102492 [Thalassospira xiamenensis M-5 = DSM 17429]